MKNNIIFISGIDTDAGKSYATGWYAKKLMDEGNLVATIKFIQTGQTDGKSIDIDVHRRIMGVNLPEDAEGLTYSLIRHRHNSQPALTTVRLTYRQSTMLSILCQNDMM